ncbi:unnamed protein product [Durusdinium trenchii]|uniref:Uncharacterized protein n=1 Tax=Durusdinium trenchii TaxID=1381693 RepID=A0ABP0KWQ7_9DINO
MAALSVAIGAQHGLRSSGAARPAAPARTQPDESLSKSLTGCFALGAVAAVHRKRSLTLREWRGERTMEINYYQLDAMKASNIRKKTETMLEEGAAVLKGCAEESAQQKMLLLLSSPAVKELLVFLVQDDLTVLSVLKQLKYFWSLSQSHLAILLERLAEQLRLEHDLKMPEAVRAFYGENAIHLEAADPHGVFPTSIYRQCDGLTLATEDSATIESVMSTTITTTIKIARDVLQPSNRLLFDVYKPLGRCVAVVDDKVEAHFGADLEKYFEINGIEFVKLVFSGNEVDKNLSNVEQILLALKENWQARHEPVLIVGGGVIADVAGMACALYSRNTPYVMLCTSLVAGIDAGPSPRVCCNGFSYKNLYGAYHPPALTITDRGFWRTMHPGQLRHGVAEIIKVAAMADLHLFELMEKWGKETVATNFGTLGGLDDPAFQEVCDLIIGKAMEGYVRAEYGNLWETHQCRPHAYGHTWSPGYELPSGMLHGHAVGTCMGFGAYLSYKEGWLSEVDMHRVLKVISDCELALWHPVMEDTVSVWKAQIGIVEKRGGNLCAPIPRALGESGYLNSLPERLLHQRMHEYQELCSKYPREGRGVQEHSVDVGLEDPMSKKDSIRDADRCVVTPMDRVVVQLGAASQSTSARAIGEAARIVDGIDEMVTKYSSQPSEALKNVSKRTAMTNPLWAELMGQGNTSRLMEAEMISGQAEAQLLQLLLKLSGGKDVLDIGTFTGYSSLAMAEAIPEDGTVVTLEREQEAKDMAKANWIGSPHASKIESLVGEAHDLLICLAAEDKSFDLVFLDVDKPGYFGLYQMLMDKNLLKVKGLLVVDNVMYKGEELSGTELTKNGQGAQALNQGLLDDPRVQQVMLPLRDGVTLVYRES